MPIVADYKVLLDHSFTVRVGDPAHVITFELPTQTVLPAATGDGTAPQRPILMMMVNPSSDAAGLACLITINGVTALNVSFDSAVRRAMYETIGGNRFIANAPNTFEFTATAGTGSVSFSDIVVWFQRTL